MNYRSYRCCAFILLLSAFLFLLPACACAEAEEETLGFAHVELFSEGYLTEVSAVDVGLSRGASFNNYILSELKKQKTEIDLRSFNMTIEGFKEAYWTLLNSHPEMFYIAGGFGYRNSGNIITSFQPQYKYSGPDLKRRIDTFNKELGKIVNYARQADTAIGQLLLANDYLCVNYEYDNSRKIFSPDELLETGKGVCQAYMLLYRAVLNELGLKSDYATSDAMNHTWNMVYLNGSWYHVDVTWDDPVPDIPLGAYHSFFLLSDEGIYKAEHHSWNAAHRATNTQYDKFFWADIVNPIPVIDDVIYYTHSSTDNKTRYIRSYDIESGAIQSLHSYSAVANRKIVHREPIWADRENFYYAVQNKLYIMDRESKFVRTGYNTDDDDEIITRLFFKDRDLLMYIKEVDDNESEIEKLNIKPIKLFVLPSMMRSIGREAFKGISCTDLVLQDGVESIDKRAFADCKQLENVYLPDTLKYIAEDAFVGCKKGLTFICPDDSLAEEYADDHDFDHISSD